MKRRRGEYSFLKSVLNSCFNMRRKLIHPFRQSCSSFSNFFWCSSQSTCNSEAYGVATFRAHLGHIYIRAHCEEDAASLHLNILVSLILFNRLLSRDIPLPHIFSTTIWKSKVSIKIMPFRRHTCNNFSIFKNLSIFKKFAIQKSFTNRKSSRSLSSQVWLNGKSKNRMQNFDWMK